MSQDPNKIHLFDLLYDDQCIKETPGDRARDRVELLHQAIDRWCRGSQPGDYSVAEIQVARELLERTHMAHKDKTRSEEFPELEPKAREFVSQDFPAMEHKPPECFLIRPNTEYIHVAIAKRRPLEKINLTFRVEENIPPAPVAPFRPEEFRTTQHLGGMGLANMRHPAFMRPVPPAKVQENLAAVKVTTSWTVDTSPQAVDRQARFRLALASVLPKGDVDLPKLAVDLERPLSELRMVMTVEPYGIVFKDMMDRTRHPGYSLSLRVAVNGADIGSTMADIRRAFVDTLRAIALGHD